MSTITTYQNKRNPHKFIQVKRYARGEYWFRQFIKTETDRGTIINYMGTRRNSGAFHKNGIRSMRQVLTEDYAIV